MSYVSQSQHVIILQKVTYLFVIADLELEMLKKAKLDKQQRCC